MKTAMEKWITFIVNHPRMVLLSIALLTLFFISGTGKIKMDSSVEYLMPEEEYIYKLTERVKVSMGNEKTFIIASIEPAEGHDLFSPEVFQTMNMMVEEIEEYKNFNLALENERLDFLIKAGNASFTENNNNSVEETGNHIAFNEEDLDKAMLENKSGDLTDAENILKEQNNSNEEIWDMDKPLPENRYDKPAREKRNYHISNYTPVSLKYIKSNLDETARRQLDTILIYLKYNSLAEEEHLTREQYASILNTWEDIYLFKSMNIVKTFFNPISGEDISGFNHEITAVNFIEKKADGKRDLPFSKNDFIEYENKIRLNPLNSKILYSLNENNEIRAFAITLSLRSLEHYNSFYNIFHCVFEKYNTSPLDMHLMGNLVIEKYIEEFMQRDLSALLPFVLGIVILTFYLNFRSLRGVLLPTLTVSLALIWTMGLMGHLGIKLSILLNILPPLLIAIGSSYSIHLFNQYMLELKHFTAENMKKALIASMNHVSGTVFLAAFTTCISFLTLTNSQISSMKHFGILAAIGAFFGMLISFLLIPGVLILLKPIDPEKIKKKKEKNIITNFIIHKLSHLSTNHAKLIFAFSIVLFIPGIAGIMKIRSESTPMFYFKEGTKIRDADERLSELFNGAFPVNLVFDTGKKNGVKDPEVLKFIDGIQKWSEESVQKENYNILSTSSFGDFIKRMNMAVNDDKKEYFVIPDSEQTIVDYLDIFSGEDVNSDGRPDALEQFVDADYRRVNLIITTGSTRERLFSTRVNNQLVNHVRNHLENPATVRPDHLKYFFAGSSMSFSFLADYIFESQALSVLLSLVIIFLLIYFLFRRIKASFIALVPICFGISQVYGLMGFFGIPLDIPKTILSSIAIGIGIDDTIHFMRNVSYFQTKGMNLKDAIYHAQNEAGLAIIYTSLALIAGFSVLLISNFKPVFDLGFLISTVMFATTLGALLFLPAYIYLFNINISKYRGDKK